VAKKYKKGERAVFYTHLYVREDAQELYGFLTARELRVFELLTSVSGIGPRTGLGVLESASITQVVTAVQSGDHSVLTRVPGIGRKTAERIVLELKDKFLEVKVAADKVAAADSDNIQALVGLGFSAAEAEKALGEVAGSVKGSSERIKAALKILGKVKAQ
jgi:Holliday junction DNA helicase RuvA